MISNEVQYRNTQRLLAEFESTAAELEASAGHAGRPQLRETQIAAVRSQADTLRDELAAYEQLRPGQQDTTTAQT